MGYLFNLALICLALLGLVDAHAFLVDPPSGQYLQNKARVEYCPHCYNGGGVGIVKAATPAGDGPVGSWPLGYGNNEETDATAVRHGLCGDRVDQPSLYMPGDARNPGRTTHKTYVAGDIVEFTVGVATHHRGHYEFRLCELGVGETLTQGCLDEHVLLRADDPGHVSPVDLVHPERYYMEPTCAPNTKGLSSAEIKAASSVDVNYFHYMKYKIPSTVACDFCVIQWYYVTANSCNPPGYADSFDRGDWPNTFIGCPSDGGYSSFTSWFGGPTYQSCGLHYPEEFWGCANVKVLPQGSTNPDADEMPSSCAAEGVTCVLPSVLVDTACCAVPGTCGSSTTAACNSDTCCQPEGAVDMPIECGDSGIDCSTVAALLIDDMLCCLASDDCNVQYSTCSTAACCDKVYDTPIECADANLDCGTQEPLSGVECCGVGQDCKYVDRVCTTESCCEPADNGADYVIPDDFIFAAQGPWGDNYCSVQVSLKTPIEISPDGWMLMLKGFTPQNINFVEVWNAMLIPELSTSNEMVLRNIPAYNDGEYVPGETIRFTARMQMPASGPCGQIETALLHSIGGDNVNPNNDASSCSAEGIVCLGATELVDSPCCAVPNTCSSTGVTCTEQNCCQPANDDDEPITCSTSAVDCGVIPHRDQMCCDSSDNCDAQYSTCTPELCCHDSPVFCRDAIVDCGSQPRRDGVECCGIGQDCGIIDSVCTPDTCCEANNQNPDIAEVPLTLINKNSWTGFCDVSLSVVTPIAVDGWMLMLEGFTPQDVSFDQIWNAELLPELTTSNELVVRNIAAYNNGVKFPGDTISFGGILRVPGSSSCADIQTALIYNIGGTTPGPDNSLSSCAAESITCSGNTEFVNTDCCAVPNTCGSTLACTQETCCQPVPDELSTCALAGVVCGDMERLDATRCCKENETCDDMSTVCSSASCCVLDSTTTCAAAGIECGDDLLLDQTCCDASDNCGAGHSTCSTELCCKMYDTPIECASAGLGCASPISGVQCCGDGLDCKFVDRVCTVESCCEAGPSILDTPVVIDSGETQGTIECSQQCSWESVGGQIRANGQDVNIKGTSWFGFETNGPKAPHGCWNHQSAKDCWDHNFLFLSSNGFNALRIPLAMDAIVANAPVSDWPYGGKLHLDILDEMIYYAGTYGMVVMLDLHVINPQLGLHTDLWYDPAVHNDVSGTQHIMDVIDILLARYKDTWNVFAIDIYNEPHGEASWANGVDRTDWHKAATAIANHVITGTVHTNNMLVFVEGVGNGAVLGGTNEFNHWWGGNLEGVRQSPIVTDNDLRVVYSPHVYGPDVYMQPYFSDGSYPSNLPHIYDTHFGFITDRAVVIGEWGGKYETDADRAFQNTLALYMNHHNMVSNFYWCLNPNSGDTGGLWEGDWSTPDYQKLQMITSIYNGKTIPPKFKFVNT